MGNNLLIHGDNLQAIKYLLENGFKGKIDLIYIDPPYFTQKDYYYTDKQTKKKDLAYTDKWDDLQSYLNFLRERLILMKELLSEKGSIYVHLDWHASHYVKVMMDEIFGYDNFRNEIVWHRSVWTTISRQFQKAHDVILWYSKQSNYTFNQLYQPYKYLDKRHGSIQKVVNGKWIRLKDEKGNYITRDYSGVAMHDVWEDINIIGATGSERLNFGTQKPEALLERIIKTSSNEGDIVADFFCGSGTTLAVAEKLGRRWIGVDNSDVSIEVTKKRLTDSDYVFLSMNDLIVNNWSEFFIFEQ